MTTFESLGLSPALLRSVAQVGFDKPTPIQAQAIPLVLEGHDVMGLAQTGTGKTAAFGLPLIQHLLKDDIRPPRQAVRALILAPTRELVNQIAENLRSYVRHLRIERVIGGQSINIQIKRLERGTDILVATPGRLLDLVEREALYLDTTTFLVLDEADQMLDLGFIHSLKQISRLVGRPRQTLLFSATMPKSIEDLSRSFQNDPVRIQVAPPGKAADKVRQTVHFVEPRAKIELLKDCLIERRNDLSLVFARTKHGAEKLMRHLVECGFKAASIHGNKSQSQRDKAIEGFKTGDVRILVATDVAARGIDIPGVTHVYNFNLPEVPENYVHRIGRTARAGADGAAVAFCSADEYHLFREVEKLMGIKIPVGTGEPPTGGVADAARKKRNDARAQNQRNRSKTARDGRRGESQDGKPKKDGTRNKKRASQAPKNAKPGAARSGAARPGSAKPGGNRTNSRPGGAKRRPAKRQAARA